MALPSDSTEAPDRNATIRLSEEDIMRIACNFTEFSSTTLAPGVTIREGLDNTDDLIRYGVSETCQKQLWKEEIARLVTAVTNMDDPIYFADSADFNIDSKEAHESLAGLADKMLIALYIVFHDAQGCLLNHMPGLVAKTTLLKESRQRLESFFINLSDDNDDDAEWAKSRHARLAVLNINHADYFEFVNYVTATIVRMLCKAASGKRWHDTIISKLAKMAAKMKVVSGNLREHVVMSLRKTPNVKPAPKRNTNQEESEIQSWDDQGRNMHEDLEEMLGMLGHKGRASFVGPITAHRAVRELYFRHEAMVQYPIFKIFENALVSLRGKNTLRTVLSTSYEVCAMVYKAGYNNFPVFLFQDIDGEYLGSSSDENINVSHASFHVAYLAVKGLADRLKVEKEKFRNAADSSVDDTEQHSADNSTQPQVPIVRRANGVNNTPPTSPSSPKSVGTSISWYYKELQGSGSRNVGLSSDVRLDWMPLNTMSDVITVMVPITLTSPTFVTNVIRLIGFFTTFERRLNYGEPPVLYRPTEFQASFCLTTDEYQKMWRDQPERGISQLSASFVARDTLLSWQPSEQVSDRVGTPNLELPTTQCSCDEGDREPRREERIQQSLKQFAHARNRKEEWVFEENGVRVRCDWYVGIVSAVAAVLVFGGIAAGITMGERLPGVDPFNVTTFSWVLAAFIILIAKSFRVASWTWWDFLHRQVLCRSVSELRAVTGIDDQLILALLLQEESATPLQTRGPYNTVFSNKTSGGDGFSIDRPLGIRTMLLSGLIMIEVQAIYHGKFLVCLDLRRGTEFNRVSQTMVNEEYITGDRLIDESSPGKGRRIILTETKISWGRIVGVYGQKDAIFC